MLPPFFAAKKDMTGIEHTLLCVNLIKCDLAVPPEPGRRMAMTYDLQISLTADNEFSTSK